MYEEDLYGNSYRHTTPETHKMFEVLAQFAVARGAMLSGPKCQDGAFVGNDDWVGNNDQNNKLQKKGEGDGQEMFRQG